MTKTLLIRLQIRYAAPLKTQINLTVRPVLNFELEAPPPRL